MATTSPTQPLCRYCGKAIAKRTTTVQFGSTAEAAARNSSYWRYRVETPTTKAEAQKLLNETVVSVKRHGNGDLWMVGVWDGESYVDGFFHNGKCAKRFAYLMAREGRCTAAYNEAMRARTNLT